MKVPEPAAVIEPGTGTKAGRPERFRRLKWNELVKRGDFVADGRQGFEPWAGLAGFRADAFVKQIFRRIKNTSPAGKILPRKF